ncbi:peptidase E [Bacillus sp. V33-4]|uniref:Type 1 glutamine amidotransferase-like domain-containing protein n=1 Tax=Bacillus sp. V33-4 TaxID=2054169 RepID=UPI000C77C317|nr:peptidase E [Bacillus sp. V33-4]PLR84530.1 peptidase E [Bacillus sp. V33-4]
MKQIIAMGGGGFSMEPENLLLDEYVLKQSGKQTPSVCFVPTASGDADNYISRFYQAFETLDCRPSHLSLFSPPTRDLENYILEKDIIYVGGGNTKNLLVLWKEWGLDHYLRTAWEQGIILAGVSAGAICWFEQGVTDSYGDGLSELHCLGFLKGSCCPHYDGEEQRRPGFHRVLRDGVISNGIAADDGVAFHFVGEELKQVVSSRPNAKGYNVKKLNSKIIETEIDTMYLG